jgi:hypothetical protein
MLQTIAAICTIISFGLGICTTLADSPEWQRYSLFGFAFICFTILLAERKIRLRKTDGTITLKGTQSLPFPHERIEVEIFYSKPFTYTPNLTVRFPRKMIPDTGLGHVGSPGYEVTEQRPDGFKIKVSTLGRYYEPVVKWTARGRPED